MKNEIGNGSILLHKAGWQGVCLGIDKKYVRLQTIYAANGEKVVNSVRTTVPLTEVTLLDAFTFKDRTLIPKKIPKQKNPSTIDNTWEFHCDQKNLVNEKLLKQELSNITPLIIMEVYIDGEPKTWAMIDHSIKSKALNCNIPSPPKTLISKSHIIDITDQGVDIWVKWCEDVRATKWKNKYKIHIRAYSIKIK